MIRKLILAVTMVALTGTPALARGGEEFTAVAGSTAEVAGSTAEE